LALLLFFFWCLQKRSPSRKPKISPFTSRRLTLLDHWFWGIPHYPLHTLSSSYQFPNRLKLHGYQYHPQLLPQYITKPLHPLALCGKVSPGISSHTLKLSNLPASNPKTLVLSPSYMLPRIIPLLKLFMKVPPSQYLPRSPLSLMVSHQEWAHSINR